MSSLAIPSSATAALPAVNVHPHGHGHKKGATDSATDSRSSTAAQIPAGASQGLFGNLLTALESVIGIQAPNVPAAVAPAAAATTAATTASNTSKINVLA